MYAFNKTIFIYPFNVVITDIKQSPSPVLTTPSNQQQQQQPQQQGNHMSGQMNGNVTALLSANSGISGLPSTGSEHSSLSSPVNLASVSHYRSPSPPKAVPVKMESDASPYGHGPSPVSMSHDTTNLSAVPVGAN